VIVGIAPLADHAAAIARTLQSEREVSVAILHCQRKFKFDFTSLEGLTAESQDAFVALDARAVNFSRLEMVSMLKARGFALARLIAKGAFVDPGHRIGENTIVHVGASVSPDARVGYNVVIGPGCAVGPGARIGNSVYLGAGAVIGAGAMIGDNTTIGAGVIIEAGVKVGKQGEILIRGVYGSDIPDKTFHAPGYDGPVRIIKF
jgi:UDP-3-O-[3-hydroxymyristoyl] glucosamine N-acyltransferase